MVSIRFGAWDYRPLWYVSSSNKMEGILGPYVNELVDVILHKLNVTFVPVDQIATKCLDNGTCTKALHDLQIGKVDLCVGISFNDMLSLGDNLTFVSSFSDASCYLGYKRALEVNVGRSTFLDFTFAFDLYFWSTLFVFFGTFLVILCLTIRQREPSMNTIIILWYQFELILRQNFNSALKSSGYFLLALFMLWLFLVWLLFSSSLKTDLVSQVNYIKLETLEDIIKYDYKPIVHENAFCTSLLENDFRPISRQIKSKLTLYSTVNKSFEESYHFSRREKIVDINSVADLRLKKSVGCIHSEEEEKSEPFDVSGNSIFETLIGMFINKHNRPEINHILIKRIYGSFEGGLSNYDLHEKIKAECLSLSNASISCMDSKQGIETSWTPISLNFLFLPFTFLLSALIVISALHVINGQCNN